MLFKELNQSSSVYRAASTIADVTATTVCTFDSSLASGLTNIIGDGSRMKFIWCYNGIRLHNFPAYLKHIFGIDQSSQFHQPFRQIVG